MKQKYIPSTQPHWARCAFDPTVFASRTDDVQRENRIRNRAEMAVSAVGRSGKDSPKRLAARAAQSRQRPRALVVGEFGEGVEAA